MVRGGEVTAVVLTHAPGSGTLHACLRSLVGQSHPVDIFLVDNSVGADRAVVDDACRAFPGVRRTSPGRNLGFARGVNLALSRVTTPFVLILNDDSTLEPGATAAMRRSLDADAGTVAVAPKILLARHPHVLDGVGTVIRPDGLAFNRGIGQFDIGQYDEARPVFGVSFAACLIRRRAFEPDEVGPLDGGFNSIKPCRRSRRSPRTMSTFRIGAIQLSDRTSHCPSTRSSRNTSSLVSISASVPVGSSGRIRRGTASAGTWVR